MYCKDCQLSKCVKKDTSNQFSDVNFCTLVYAVKNRESTHSNYEEACAIGEIIDELLCKIRQLEARLDYIEGTD